MNYDKEVKTPAELDREVSLKNTHKSNKCTCNITSTQPCSIKGHADMVQSMLSMLQKNTHKSIEDASKVRNRPLKPIEKRYGKLTTGEMYRIRRNDKNITVVDCVCDCGQKSTVRRQNLVSGRATSCGCYGKSLLGIRNFKHGMATGRKMTPLYKVWLGMIGRTCTKTCADYKNYGGRGIKMSDEWRNSFIPFRDWAMSNGYSPKLTIERIDNDGNYCAENCTWATRQQQSLNTRRARANRDRPTAISTLKSKLVDDKK